MRRGAALTVTAVENGAAEPLGRRIAPNASIAFFGANHELVVVCQRALKRHGTLTGPGHVSPKATAAHSHAISAAGELSSR